MLPPKLAQTIINLAVGDNNPSVILDPFCGTGVVLQESSVMGYDIYGTDISPKMIDYTKANLEWLKKQKAASSIRLNSRTEMLLNIHGSYQNSHLSASLPKPTWGNPSVGRTQVEKMREIVHDTNQIIRGFFEKYQRSTSSLDLGYVLPSPPGSLTTSKSRLPVISEIDDLGYENVKFKHVELPLIYRREGQVTGRELLVLEKTK